MTKTAAEKVSFTRSGGELPPEEFVIAADSLSKE